MPRSVCLCGHAIPLGSFPNAGVYKLISENRYDQVDDPVDRQSLEMLYFQAEQVLKCSKCGRLTVFWERGCPTFYSKEEQI